MTKDVGPLFHKRAEVVTVCNGVTIYMPQAVFLPGSPDHLQRVTWENYRKYRFRRPTSQNDWTRMSVCRWELEMYFYNIQRRCLSPLKFEEPHFKVWDSQEPWLIMLDKSWSFCTFWRTLDGCPSAKGRWTLENQYKGVGYKGLKSPKVIYKWLINTRIESQITSH